MPGASTSSTNSEERRSSGTSSQWPTGSQAASNQQVKLQIVEWPHMDTAKFYPMALTSSWAIKSILYPLNVVKARLQLQRQNQAYRSTRHAFVNMYQQEGVRAFFRGYWVTLPQILGSFAYSTIYERSRSELHSKSHIQSAQIVSSLAGCFAAIFTQILLVPTDVVSQNMMIYNRPKDFTGGGSGSAKNMAVIDFLRNQVRQSGGSPSRLLLGIRMAHAIYRVDGLLGFYRGFAPSIILYSCHAACFWSFYYTWLDLLKWVRTELKPTGSNENAGGALRGLIFLQGVAGGLGGATAAACTNSLEVFRLRIQVHRMGYLETFRKLHSEEGFRTFTKGLAPRMMNNGLQSALIMTGYEAIKRLSVLPKYRDAVVW